MGGKSNKAHHAIVKPMATSMPAPAGRAAPDTPGAATSSLQSLIGNGALQALFGSVHSSITPFLGSIASDRNPVYGSINTLGGENIAAPAPGINKIGFIDHGDGANIRTGPAESGSQKVREEPLPPATRVFVSGTYPGAPGWWYVTAYDQMGMSRGYVQGFRVTTDLPEPTAKLYQIRSGDTAERLAVQEFSAAIRDGHDLRYYENVLLFVNKEKGRSGITGSYQDPGLFGGGANNIQLVAGHRIWLVSPAYARALEAMVPSGSLTGGAVAKLKRFARHLEDIIASVTESPSYLGEVAGEYAQAIRDHLLEIVGIIAAFILAEAASAFLAATPTGVSQIAAIVIQLGLAAFGAAGLVEAGVEALKHASEWLRLAWTASGNKEKIATASKEFLKMLVSIAMAALAYLGVKGNMAKAVKIARSLPPTEMAPVLAVAGGGQRGSAGVYTPVAIGPPGPMGPFGTAVAMTIKGPEKGSGSAESSTTKESPQTAAERDWEKAEAEAKRQEIEADKPETTEHGALRQQERGELTSAEKTRLQETLPRKQSDGATTKVLKEGRGKYTVVTVNRDGATVTVIRGKTKAELRGLSRNHHWDPPWE
jgi:hypothetical protein